MFGIVEMPLQRAEQRRRPLGRARLLDPAAEQVQLSGTGHGAVALHGHGPVFAIEGFKGQGQFGIPARTLPQWHDAVGEVLVEASQFGQGGAGVGHEGARRNRAVRHGSRMGLQGARAGTLPLLAMISLDFPTLASGAHPRK